MPNGESFRQKVTYETNPCYCTKCKSNDHLKDECTGNRPWAKKKGKKAKTTTSNQRAATGQSNSAEQVPCDVGVNLPGESSNPEPCNEPNDSPNPCTDLAEPSTRPEFCVEAAEALGPCSDVPVDPPSIPVVGDHDLNESTSDGAADLPLEDNQSTSEHAEAEVPIPEEEPANDVSNKQPAAPESTLTVGMGTRSKARAGRRGFKDALLSPPKEASSKDIGTAGGTRAGNRFVPLPVGGKPVARGGGRRQPTSGVK